MRRLVPLLLLSLFSFQAMATFQTWAAYADDNNCGDPQTDEAKARCNGLRAGFCGARPTVGNVDTGCQLETPDNFSKETADAEAASAKLKCDKAFNQATQACNGPVAPNDIAALIGGQNAGANQMAGESRSAGLTGIAIGGQCDGGKARCQKLCTEVGEKLTTFVGTFPAPTPPTDDPDKGLRDSISPKAQLLKKQGSDCGRLSSEKAKAEAKAALDASDRAKDIASRTGAQNPGGENTPSGKPSGGGAGGINPAMLAPLAKMAMDMMNQPPTTPPVTPPQPMQTASTGGECNPNLAGSNCPTGAVSDSWNAKRGTVEATSPKMANSNFNVGDGSDMTPASAETGGAVTPGSPPTVGGIPNGGGAMPGGGGGGAASLGAGAGGGVGSAGGSTKDVLHGLGSGGGGMAAMAANMNMKNGESGGGYTYGQGGSRDPAGLDLSQFLPGAKNDPNKVAGLARGSGNFQIQSKTVNIWSRISERIRARCSQGLLRDCVP